MFGGYGGYEHGWDGGRRALYVGGRAQCRRVGARRTYRVARQPEMAYTVAIERGDVRPQRGHEFAPKALRVTEIFRREGAHTGN